MVSSGNVLWTKPSLAFWGNVPFRETSGNILRLLWPAATTGCSLLVAMVQEATFGSATPKADDEVQMLPSCQLLCCWQWDDKQWYSLLWPPLIDWKDVNCTSVCICCWEGEGWLKIFKGSLQTLPPIPCWAGFDWMKLTSGWWVVRPETLLRKETFCWWSTWSSVQEQVGSWGISGAKSTLLSGKRMARLLYKIAVLIVCSLNCWTRSYWNLVLIMVFDHPFPEFFFCELHFLRPNGTHVRMDCCRLRHLEK